MIVRDLAPKLVRASTQAPAVTLTGPRQSGKTTLCRTVFPQHPYVTLEAPDERLFATEDPKAFLAQFPGGAILDEVQRVPDLLSYLQGVIDDDPTPGRWILSGSQNLSLPESISQSLAGRTEVHNLLPLTRSEIARLDEHPSNLEETLFAGSYPRIFDRRLYPSDWLRSYVATYLERDVRTITNVGDLAMFSTLRRTVCRAHRTIDQLLDLGGRLRIDGRRVVLPGPQRCRGRSHHRPTPWPFADRSQVFNDGILQLV